MAIAKSIHSRECAEWQAKLDRSLAEALKNSDGSNVEIIHQFAAAAGKEQISIEGDAGEGNGTKEYIDLVMLDSEYIAIFEYEDDPNAGIGVIALHIAAVAAWADHLAYYENRFFSVEDIKKLKSFHDKHLKLYKQHKTV